MWPMAPHLSGVPTWTASFPARPRIGLTGGIASGKSSAAAVLRDAGVCVIDLDEYSRQVLDVPGEGVEDAIARFGERFRAASGTIDREAMAALVFSDPQARADLERIVLGRVDEEVRRHEAEAVAAGAECVVHDNPLLFERGRDDDYVRIIAVLAPREERITRIVRDRGKDRAYALSVMAAQVSDLERIRRADRLVLNSASREQLSERTLHAFHAVMADLHDESG